jgi:hypothetical protein
MVASHLGGTLEFIPKIGCDKQCSPKKTAPNSNPSQDLLTVLAQSINNSSHLEPMLII